MTEKPQTDEKAAPVQKERPVVIDHTEEINDLIDSVGNPNQKTVDTLLAEKNTNVQTGNAITHKGRIFGGNQYRVAVLFDYLEHAGCDKTTLDNYRTSIFGNTVGLCMKIPDHGLRGELLDATKPRPQPQKQQGPEARDSFENNNQTSEGQ